MTSEIRANTLKNRVGLGTISFTNTGPIVSGIVTATTFVGALTGTSSGNPTLTSGADNRVITASSASAIQGEASLQFDGTRLGIGGAPNNIALDITKNTQGGLRITDTSVSNASFEIRPQTGNSTKMFRIIDVSANLDRFNISASGNVGISSQYPTGKFDIALGGNSYVKFGQDADNPKMEMFRSTGGSPSHYSVELQQILGDFIFSNAPSANLGSHSYTERLRIDSSGKIGMGLRSTSGNICDPDGNGLLIRAATTVATNKGHIMLTGDGATNGEGPQIVFSESGSGGNFAGAYVGHIRTGSNSIGDLVFGTRATSGDANTVPTEKLRISSTGLTTLKNFNGTGLKLQGSGSDYQGMQLQVTDASASQTRNVFIDAVNETGAAVANQVGQIQSDGGSHWSWSTQASGNRSDRRVERLRITSGGVIQTGSKTITGGNNLAIQNFAVKGIWSGANSIGKSIELISGFDSAVKMAAVGYNLTDTNTGSTYGGDLTFHTQPLYSSPTTPLPVRMRISSSGHVTTPQQPAFVVHSGNTYYTHGSSTGTLNVTTLTTVLFDTTSSYATGTNIYTAPVSGKYFMAFMFAYKSTSGYLNVKLSKAVGNGSFGTYGRMFSGPPQQSSLYNNGQAVIGVIDLAKGDRVRPQVEVNYSGNQLVNCHWSGYLLG